MVLIVIVHKCDAKNGNVFLGNKIKEEGGWMRNCVNQIVQNQIVQLSNEGWQNNRPLQRMLNAAFTWWTAVTLLVRTSIAIKGCFLGIFIAGVPDLSWDVNVGGFRMWQSGLVKQCCPGNRRAVTFNCNAHIHCCLHRWQITSAQVCLILAWVGKRVIELIKKKRRWIAK